MSFSHGICFVWRVQQFLLKNLFWIIALYPVELLIAFPVLLLQDREWWLFIAIAVFGAFSFLLRYALGVLFMRKIMNNDNDEVSFWSILSLWNKSFYWETLLVSLLLNTLFYGITFLFLIIADWLFFALPFALSIIFVMVLVSIFCVIFFHLSLVFPFIASEKGTMKALSYVNACSILDILKGTGFFFLSLVPVSVLMLVALCLWTPFLLKMTMDQWMLMGGSLLPFFHFCFYGFLISLSFYSQDLIKK